MASDKIKISIRLTKNGNLYRVYNMTIVTDIKKLFLIFSIQRITDFYPYEKWGDGKATLTNLFDGETYTIDHLNKIFYN